MNPSPSSISVAVADPDGQAAADNFVKQFGSRVKIVDAGAEYALVFSSDGVQLCPVPASRHGSISVDFVSGKSNHRRLFGGGKSQLIAKAVGIPIKNNLYVCDATAGLGQDAFAMASLGCQVDLLESSPVAYALLQDGLARAHISNISEAQAIVARMDLKFADSKVLLSALPASSYDVVYIDPMFPEKSKKKSAIRKEMQAFQSLIGYAGEDKGLIDAALSASRYRTVVKRPSWAGPYATASPTYSLAGKTCRFDIYTNKSLKAS